MNTQIPQFAATCDATPSDQLTSNAQQIHTFGIIGGSSPGTLIALADRIKTRMGTQAFSKWAGKSDSYKIQFIQALLAEAPGLEKKIGIYYANENDIIGYESIIRRSLPARAYYRHDIVDGKKIIKLNGITTNIRTQTIIKPSARWHVGVVISWQAACICDYHTSASNGGAEVMVLLPDSFPLDGIDQPGGTSLLRAICHYKKTDKIQLQFNGERVPDNPAEALIDHIVGLFHEKNRRSDQLSAQAQACFDQLKAMGLITCKGIDQIAF